MSEQQSPPAAAQNRWVRAAALVLGLVLPQVLEFGPSLVGGKVLLPLDLLAFPLYLPNAPEYRDVKPGNAINLDKVLAYEPTRRFAASELRAGRFATWQPFAHGGTPFIPPPFSVFTLMYMAAPDPVTLAWMQLAKAVLVGLGAFVFFRFALGAGFWPSAVGAWAFPLCGYMVFWQGHYLSDAATWLPWVLFATDRVVRRPGGWGGPGLGLAVGISALNGVPDVIAQTLLASGLYAIFRQATERGRSLRRAVVPAGVVVLGWVSGVLLGACYLLPVVSFAGTGSRVQERGAGREERPPVGISALPQALLPFCHGSHERADVPAYTGKLVLPESAATGYAGLLAALVAAPLAVAERRHRPAALFWCGVAFLGLSWQLGVPGVVDFWRLPGFNLVSHNRDTLLTAFAVVAAAVLGLDSCAEGVRWRRGFWVPVGALALLGLWSLSQAASPPDPIGKAVEEIRKNPRATGSEASKMWQAADERFHALSLWGAAVCAAGLGWWAAAVWKFGPGPRAGRVLGGALVVELILTGWGYNTQADPRLYYPPIPPIESLRDAPPGRFLGVRSLPPNISAVTELRDIRGDDGVDPKHYVELLETAADPNFKSPNYARTQYYVPRIKFRPGTGHVKLPPVMDLLGVRYLVFIGPADKLPLKPDPQEGGYFVLDTSGAPPAPNRDKAALKPVAQGGGYFVMENPRALPRAFVPRRAEPAPDRDELLRALKSDSFVPSEVAYVEGLTAPAPKCTGTVEVLRDVPGHLEVRVATDGPGVLLVTDGFYDGWEARVNDQPAAVRRANHALCAIEVSGGTSTVTLNYRSRALARGLRLSLAAGSVLTLWAGWVFLAHRRRKSAEPTPAGAPVK